MTNWLAPNRIGRRHSTRVTSRAKGGSQPTRPPQLLRRRRKASSAIQVEAVTNRQSSTGFDGIFAVEWNPFLCSIPAD
jgi:hypothetical protein